jgi:hypothetical protein
MFADIRKWYFLLEIQGIRIVLHIILFAAQMGDIPNIGQRQVQQLPSGKEMGRFIKRTVRSEKRGVVWHDGT